MSFSQTPPSNDRLDGLDIARYVAFVGMVIVNFKIAMGAPSDDSLLSPLTAALQGRAAATFVVLAGIGLGLSGLKGINHTLAITLKMRGISAVCGSVEHADL